MIGILTEQVHFGNGLYVVRASALGSSAHGSAPTVEEAEDRAMARLWGFLGLAVEVAKQAEAETVEDPSPNLQGLRVQMVHELSRIGRQPDWLKEVIQVRYGVRSSAHLTVEQAEELLDWLKSQEVAA